MALEIRGVDLSHANEDVDLHELVAAGGLSFIGLKATEGVKFVDPTFVDRFNRIRKFLPNVLIVAYHFLRTDSPPADQMGHFYDVLQSVGYFDYANTLAPAVDAERGLAGQEPSEAEVQASIGAFTELSGCRPGVYSGQDYWRTHLAEVEAAYRWVARYSAAQPSIPFDLWQRAENWQIAGHRYDYNVAYVSMEQFRIKFGRKKIAHAA